MVNPRLVLVLGDQLTPRIAALRSADPARDIVVMAEVAAEAESVRHHPQKIALIFTAMRKHAARLEKHGWRVLYSRLDDARNSQSLVGELLRRAAETGAQEVIATRPGEWRVIHDLEAAPLPVSLLADDRFICSEAEFAVWAEGRTQLRMEHFYREMRRRTGLLMEGTKPAGGHWNFDAENRKPAQPDLFRAAPLRFPPDAVTEEVLEAVEHRFPRHFGSLRPFGWATDPDQAEQALAHFLRQSLPRFGDEQDAMLSGDPTLSHALISPSLNLGLLDPMEVCRRAEAEWRAGRAPLNAVEGFIRQILGWREFIRGIWSLAGPGYPASNALDHHRPLPPLYWGSETRMRCLSQVVAQTRDMAYAHHIQRLMVTGNFALLAGLDPADVHDWYLSVYADALEWVEAPNTIGMSQFADGGMVGSKPYAASGAYINRMSDYCGGCAYDVTDRSSPNACPFNPLYWHFLSRHRERFARNPRMTPIYRNWDRMDAGQRTAILDRAGDILARLEVGETV